MIISVKITLVAYEDQAVGAVTTEHHDGDILHSDEVEIELPDEIAKQIDAAPELLDFQVAAR